MNKKLILKILICFYIFVFCGNIVYSKQNKVQEIKNRGFIIVGTTGDYRPMSYFNYEKGCYEGFDMSLAEDLAKSLGVSIKYVSTSWPVLMQDTTSEKFDLALSGITITAERKKQALMSKGYLNNGKTVLCRVEDKNKYTDIKKINQPNVRVMENPGGLNEKFAKKNLPKALLIIHNNNNEIAKLISEGKADVMITDTIEAKYYSQKNKRLAAPVINHSFTKDKIGILMPKNSKTLLKYVNNFIDKEYKNGRLYELTKIYIDND
ncbi:transporter substrate-binding domain-containing protein [bacterium]|nr:transporter substrate-binding domain-containing protein [bacterium]